MGSNAWLEQVAKLHKEWVKIATVYGAGDDAEDLVQESYIKLIKYDCAHQVIKNGKVQKGFMFFVVKNTVLNHHKKQKEYVYEVPKNLEADPVDEKEEAWDAFCTKVDEIADTWHWSDRQIFNDYRFTEDSIRGIGRKYDISFVSIFGTIKECKNHLLYELKEDWEDLQNGDFDKI